MRDGWRRLPLGDVAKLDVERVLVAEGRRYRAAGVLNEGKGLFVRETLSSTDTNYSHLHRLRAGQLVMRKLTAFEGSIGIVPAELADHFVSPEFPTFTLEKSELLPEYMSLICKQPSFWHEMWLRSTGTVQRRKRVNPEALLSIEIDLPPLREQRRIVDLVVSVDSYVTAARAEAAAASRCHSAIRDDALQLPEVDTAPLAQVTTKIGSGATPRGGEASYRSDGVALIRSQNVHDGRFLWDGLARISDEQAAALDGVSVEAGDVLINITGASVNRVCVVPEHVLPARVNQHVAILRADPVRLLPEFLATVLRRRDLKLELDQLAKSGTTRQALTKQQLGRFEIPVPSLTAQAEWCALDSCANDVATRATEVAQSAAKVRADLVPDLLSGSHEIPEAYDALLGEAV